MKVKFGLSNAYYAVIDPSTDTYGTPVKLPGAVSMSFDAQGESTPFFADNIRYWTSQSNAGYEGDFEIAMIPQSFKTDVLGEILDTNKVLVEKGGLQPKAFALGVKIDTDDNKGIYYWFYNCSCSRPGVAGNTTTDSTEPTTDTITISIGSRGVDGLTRVATTETTSDTVIAGWFTNVYEPALT